MIKKCWWENTCKRQIDICDNLTQCKKCTRYLQMQIQTKMANIPGELPIDHFLDDTQKDLEAYTKLKNLDIQDFVVKGKSLVIESEYTGNGKSSFAKKLLLRYMAKKVGRINTGYFLNLPIALAEIKEAITNKKDLPYLQVFKTVRLLVIDEVGYKPLSEFEENWLLRMIEERNSKPGLATIYTLNSSENLKNSLGSRLYSRIYVASDHVIFREGDKRGWASKK